jgi:non-heme chloroperoxidase
MDMTKSLLAAGFTDRLTTPDGVSIAVSEWGNPSGPELLFIHGVGQSHLSFVRQMGGDLSRDHRIIAFDTRGHGASDKPLDSIYYQETKRWADEVQAVIEAKHLQKPVLVGWSMGGRIIGQYLSIYGDRHIGGINFVAARAIADPRFSGAAMVGLPVAKPYDLASRIAASAGFLRACYHRQPTDAEFAVALAYNMLPPAEVLSAIRSWPANIPATTAALQAVTVPTLVTHGRADVVVLRIAAEHTAGLIPGATLSWYDDCGHSPFFEDAPRYNRELAQLVARIC